MVQRKPLVSLEVVNFRREMDRIRKEVQQLANVEIDELVNYAVDQLQIVTPVDTGEARQGWLTEERRQLDGYRGAVIANDVEYISYLNNGSSQQAPSFFIEQVLLEIGIITQR